MNEGVKRNLDGLGRFCIPKEIRCRYGLYIGTSVEFFVEGDRIIIKKFPIHKDLDEIIETIRRTR